MNNKRIIITGFMGSGKSTVASALARLLNCEMIDLDEMIAHDTRRSPRQIIEEDGESSFRQVETNVLAEVLKSEGTCVVALGGGAWTLERNLDLIRGQGGIGVWLDAPFSLCWERILGSGDERPLARDKWEARKLYRERLTSYERADLHVEADGSRSPEEIAGQIAQYLWTRGK